MKPHARPVFAAGVAAVTALVLSSAASAKTDFVRDITRHRASTNLVANGSFESSLSGWTNYRANLSRVSGGTDGAYAARVALSGGSTSGGFSIVPTGTPVTSTAAGTTYTAGASIRTSRPDLMTCLRIRIYNGATQTGDVTSCLNGASTWTPFNAVSYNSATAGRRLDVYVYAWNVRKGDSFQVDGISLTAGAPLPPPPPANVRPTARAAVSPSSAVAGTVLGFDGSASSDSDGTIASYAWSFGDGTTGTGANATHAYASAGAYTATLTVTDDKGATGTAAVAVTATSPTPTNVPPVARLGFSPAGPQAGQAVTFDGSASSDADGTIAAYTWNFGDGSGGGGSSATHAFGSAGTYAVTLTVTDDKGATNSASLTMTVTSPPPPPPPPASVTATAIDNAHIQLAWPAVANAASYRVSRGGAVLGTVTAPAFTDALLWPSTQYSYTVQAMDAAGATLATLNVAATTTSLPSSGFQRPFPSTSVWNTPVGSSPLHANSSAYSAYFAARAGSANMPLKSWAVGVAEARPGDATYNVPCTKYTCTLGAFGAFPIPLTAKQDPSSDGHLAVYDPATQREWDMWIAAPTGSGWTAGAGAAVSMAGNGVSPAGYASGNAANFPLLGGLIRPEEILQGRIDHALVFGMPGVNNTGYVCPATHNDGDTTDPNAPKEGTRFQLDPSLDVDALAIPAWKKTIAKALQTYGMYLRDSSGSFAIYAENPGSRGYDAWALVGLGSSNAVSLGGIPWDRMRALSAPC